jgi:C1A family cysteine protease
LDGYPVIFGFNVYESFKNESVEKTGIMSMPNTQTEQMLGGHAVLIVGNTTISDTEYYIVRNSWGTQWGDKGYFYMPKEYVENADLASDFWSIKLVNDDEVQESHVLNEIQELLDGITTTTN